MEVLGQVHQAQKAAGGREKAKNIHEAEWELGAYEEPRTTLRSLPALISFSKDS